MGNAIPTLTTTSMYLLHYFFSHPQSHLCTVPDIFNQCGSEDPPVCALMKGTGKGSAMEADEYYQQTMANQCTACSDANAFGYIPGECPASTQICTTALQETVCSPLDDPVCGFKECKTKVITSRTAKNNCKACKSSLFTVHGKCDSLTLPSICEESDRGRTDCTDASSPVCGYFGRGGVCLKGLCRQNELSKCHACSNSNMLFVTEGQCQD